ncbi:MAG: hypothetical protein M3Z20_02690 [Chloroflexota bacterium]|nr:hypothetical protein [Chloroflexota bacterium]
MQRPKLLDLAVNLIWTALVLSVLSGALATWRLNQNGELGSQNPIALILSFLLILAFFYLLTLKLRAGKGWARAVYVTLALASLWRVIENVSGQFRASAVEGIVMIAGYAILYAAAVMLVTPQVNQWFTRRR